MEDPLLIVGKLDNRLQSLQKTGTATILEWNQIEDFSSQNGLGWIQKPNRHYTHEKWLINRPSTYCVSMEAPTLELGIPLAKGEWECLLVIDEGQLDLDQLAVVIGGESVSVNMHDFGVPSEPSLPMNRYRVLAHRLVVSSDESTHFRLNHASATVGLLAVYLLPIVEAKSDREQWYLSRLKELGEIDSNTSFDAILWEMASEIIHERPNPNFYWYWWVQLSWIHHAETTYQQLGWDWVKEKTHSSIFDRFKQAISDVDFFIMSHGSESDLEVFDRVDWLRTRLLYWVWMEQGRQTDRDEFDRSIQRLLQHHPNHERVRMYAGDLIPNPALELPESYQRAPLWSKMQYQALQRLREVAYYWINERQIPNGEMGGKLDDDVEMLRWWRILSFAGDPVVRRGYERIATGTWFSKRIKDGYSVVAKDVEHSAEPISDTAPDMAIMGDDPTFIQRLIPSYRHMKQLWTGYNDRGFRQFKSAWIGSQEILETPPQNRDLSMNSRAVKAVRYLYFLKPDPNLKTILLEWGDGWLDAALRQDKGKPKGLFPSSIRFPDAAFNGDGPNWYESDMYWDYFDWTGDARLYDHLFFCYQISNDEKYLEPMFLTLKLIQTHLKDSNRPVEQGNFTQGSDDWAANQLAHEPAFWSVIAQWRIVSGDDAYDEFLMQQGSSFLKYWISRNSKPLASAIDKVLLAQLNYNLPMRTSEVLFTDRVHVSKRGNYKDGVDILASMLTGGTVSGGTSPYMSHMWLEAPEGLTSLIDTYQRNERAAWLFLHQDTVADIRIRVFQLPEGHYEMSLSNENQLISQQPIKIESGAFHDFNISVPGGTLVRLKITPRSSVAQ